MQTYWFHILESKSAQMGAPSTYILAKSLQNSTGGAMATVQYLSWERLSGKLSSVGIRGDVLQQTKESLDSTGSADFREVSLSDDQLAQLGFLVAVA